MANVSPRRFVRVPEPSRDGGLGAALRKAFGGRQDKLPALIDRLLARLRLAR